MEEKVLLKRSSKGLWTQIILSGLLMCALALFVTWLVSIILNWAPNQGKTTALVTWVLLLAAWAIGSLKLWFDWNFKRYEIAADALIVHAKAGSWGSSQTIYRYESIISVRMTQGFFGKRYGYGDVYITIPKIQNSIVLNDVEDPLNQMMEIQKRLNERNNGATHALVN